MSFLHNIFRSTVWGDYFYCTWQTTKVALMLHGISMLTHFQKSVRSYLYQLKNTPFFKKNIYRLNYSVVATQELYPSVITESSMTVSYFPDPGVNGSQLVVRNTRLGRFLGTCDSAMESCSVTGLTTGYTYDVWVRTCSGSGPTRCMLRALPTQMALRM